MWHGAGKANPWMHVLLPALLVALRTLGDAPGPLSHGSGAAAGAMPRSWGHWLRPAPMHGYPKVFNVEADSRQEHNMAEQHE